VRILGLTLLFFACGDDSGGGGPVPKPVLGVGTFAGTFDDGAGGTLHGLVGVIADSEGRITLHLQRQELPFFEANLGGSLMTGTSTFQPIVALSGQGLPTAVALDVTDGTLHAIVRTYPPGNPNPDRTITFDGTLGEMGGSGTFSDGTTNGTWQLAPGIPLDAGRPMSPDAAIDAPMIDAPAIDAPQVDAGVD
jgi:hypothetical protein